MTEPQIDPRLLDDEEVLAAYQRTDGELGNPEADALAEELRRRNIKF